MVMSRATTATNTASLQEFNPIPQFLMRSAHMMRISSTSPLKESTHTATHACWRTAMKLINPAMPYK